MSGPVSLFRDELDDQRPAGGAQPLGDVPSGTLLAIARVMDQRQARAASPARARRATAAPPQPSRRPDSGSSGPSRAAAGARRAARRMRCSSQRRPGRVERHGEGALLAGDAAEHPGCCRQDPHTFAASGVEELRHDRALLPRAPRRCNSCARNSPTRAVSFGRHSSRATALSRLSSRPRIARLLTGRRWTSLRLA